MSVLVVITAVYIFIFCVDFVPLYRKKEKRNSWIYMAFFSAAYVITVLSIIGAKLPNPSDLIQNIVNLIFGTDL